MSIIETSKITSKGQVTIPNRIRKLLHLKEGGSVGFSLTRNGVVLVPCQVTAQSPYTPKEWAKIEKLANVKGKTFVSVEKAKDFIKSL
jgi:AbrB family looped-hinge helix DNA binding protein